ncbi:hypothetical protein BWQ96_09540 [Gracilariopsis chorda]|uniref:Uncharacterized protein n=1 Tax=Gracilariopsis chorda TaxID=448386 RepID=A0A2V3IFD0_9FLOR|nr:hypothetical protein BWQ96_09540 [Gracilariopsis chorda]|eukprot:PXF40743.1 hypothetical protein BWQ96_09540 [Gracilariopsis chorda]
MVSCSNDLGLSAPKGETFEENQVVDRVALRGITNGTCSSEHGPKTANAPDLDGYTDEGSLKQVSPAFQPSAQSLSIFDEAKKQCEGGGRTARVLRGSLGSRGTREEGTREQSKLHAPRFQPSAKSLSIFDEAKKQRYEGGRLSSRLRFLGASAARAIAPTLEDRGSIVTTSVIAASFATLTEDLSSIDVVAEEGLKLKANGEKIRSHDNGSLDAAAWCALVRQHQDRAYYLKSSNRRVHLEAKRRRQQPFTPRDRYRSPPRRSIASACWESWCLDDKTAENIRKEQENGTCKRQYEATLPGQFVKRVASTYQQLSRRMFSWFSSKMNNLWKNVYKFAKWIVGVKV